MSPVASASIIVNMPFASFARPRSASEHAFGVPPRLGQAGSGEDWLHALPRWVRFYNTERPHMGLGTLMLQERHHQWLNAQEGRLHIPSVS